MSQSNQHRSRLLRALAVILFISWDMGAAAAAQQVKPKTASGRKTVCVASDIGRTFELKTVGLVIFGNDRKSSAIGSWGIDSLVLQRLEAGLGSKFSVRSIALPAGVFAQNASGQGMFFGGRNNALQSVIRDNAKSACSYYVTATTLTGEFPGTNQAITGLGILKSDSLFKNYAVYAVFDVQIFDGRTGELIRLPIDGGQILANALTTPSWMRWVDETYWPANPAATAQHAKLRDATRRLVTKLLNQTAQRILATLTRPN